LPAIAQRGVEDLVLHGVLPSEVFWGDQQKDPLRSQEVSAAANLQPAR
jgi:hypothetical protein